MDLYIATAQGIPKIGVTGQERLSTRRAQIQNGNPFRVEMFRGFQHDSKIILEIIEEVVKQKLKRRKLQGEWFDVTPEYMARVILETAKEMKVDLKPIEMYGCNPWKKKVREKEARKHDRAA